MALKLEYGATPRVPSLLCAALSKASSVLVPCEIQFEEAEDRLAYVLALLRLGSEKVDSHGTPPLYRALSRLQLPTPASVSLLQPPRPRPVTIGLKAADGGKAKEKDTAKTILGMTTPIGEAA